MILNIDPKSRAHLDQTYAMVIDSVNRMLADLQNPELVEQTTAPEEQLMMWACTIAVQPIVDDETPYGLPGQPLRNYHFLIAELASRVARFEKAAG